MLLIDKPLRWTSFDVVKKIRILTGISKIGHAGTLDPLATGLLIICTGKFTKKINEYMAQEKEYTGKFILGATTPTYDLESAPENIKSPDGIDEEAIHSATKKFVGLIEQVPPIHSAIKKDGKPAYLMARKGQDIKMEPRKITIREFEITGINLPEVEFRVICSTGTYIRSLAFDFGNHLGCGAYLGGLCRTRIGDYLLKDAQSLVDFEAALKSAKENS
jgi:tRNA pseudouridine55 synthase